MGPALVAIYNFSDRISSLFCLSLNILRYPIDMLHHSYAKDVYSLSGFIFFFLPDTSHLLLCVSLSHCVGFYVEGMNYVLL